MNQQIIEKLIKGGPQEHGQRAGTENVPGIAGFEHAARILLSEQEQEVSRLKKLSKYLIDKTLGNIEGSFLCGHPTDRTAGIANMRFSLIEGEALVLMLNTLGICVSSSSACTSRSLTPSHVLEAMGLNYDEAQSALMVHLGRHNTDTEVNYFLEKLPVVIEKLRAISPMRKTLKDN